jgi:hypothetical protein
LFRKPVVGVYAPSPTGVIRAHHHANHPRQAGQQQHQRDDELTQHNAG